MPLCHRGHLMAFDAWVDQLAHEAGLAEIRTEVETRLLSDEGFSFEGRTYTADDVDVRLDASPLGQTLLRLAEVAPDRAALDVVAAVRLRQWQRACDALVLDLSQRVLGSHETGGRIYECSAQSV